MDLITFAASRASWPRIFDDRYGIIVSSIRTSERRAKKKRETLSLSIYLNTHNARENGRRDDN